MDHSHERSPALAAQLRLWSNVGHWIIGALLAIVGAVTLLEMIGILGEGWRYVWPGALVVAGLALPIGILSHGHEDYGRAQVLADPQQRQHLIMGGLMFLAGVAELIALATGFKLLQYVWPMVLIIVGVMFFTHPQHGTAEAAVKARRTHRLLGGTLTLAGLARGLELIIGLEPGPLSVAWVILILAAAVQLILYREPEGAYDSFGHEQP